MKSRTARVLVVAFAIVAQAGAGYLAWNADQQARAERDAVAALDAQVRQITRALAAIEATQRGYVAEGQSSERWQTQVAATLKGATPKLSELRLAARTPEGQGALETAIEALTSFAQSDAKARDYVSSGQRLSASDVIFADGHDLLNKAAAALEDARVRENTQHETAIAKLAQTQLIAIGAAAGLTLIILFVLVPIPRIASASEEQIDVERAGLGLSQPSRRTDRPAAAGGADAGTPWLAGSGGDAAAGGHDLNATADICSLLACVRNSEQLPALLERSADVLEATGVIVWMTEGPPAMLRPVLAHGYAPATLARMGAIELDADNATATAYRSQATQTMRAEPPSGGAIVIPLVTADGCNGVMAVELKPGIEANDRLLAIGTILSAQLATLITPAPAAAGPQHRT